LVFLMTSKRALIVDDSQSARVILSRMLEKYDLQVDTAVSAESAIEYLGQHRPDVIFLDHLMPGQDGFQTMQAIKNNPQTADIPIMMFTSQQGEQYAVQARALGAIGVLPKLVKANDVSRVLYQLNLLPDRRDNKPSAFVLFTNGHGDADQITLPNKNGKDAAAVSKPYIGLLPTDWQAPLEASLKQQAAELRNYIASNLDGLAGRITGEVKKDLYDTPALQIAPPPPQTKLPYGWIAAVVAALVPAVALGLFCAQTLETNKNLSADNVQLEQTNERLNVALDRLSQEAEVRAQATIAALSAQQANAANSASAAHSATNDSAPSAGSGSEANNTTDAVENTAITE
jgi:CheY-like chemotaxis protein